MNESWQILYGGVDGTWLLVKGAKGVEPPAIAAVSIPNPIAPIGGPGRVVPLLKLGEARLVIRTVHLCASADYSHTAKLLQVDEDTARRYVAGEDEPQLTAGGWASVVYAYFTGQSLAPGEAL